MRLYGYVKGADTETLVGLDSVSLCFENATDAKRFAAFASQCAKEMEQFGEEYDHVHFTGIAPDVIIARLYDENK